MIDLLEFKSPYGVLGKWADSLFMKRYLERLLIKRNETNKLFAETDQWKKLLNMNHFLSL